MNLSGKKLRIIENILESCRYATELLHGEKYISCSVVMPTMCHFFRTMTMSDDDPAYVVRFKKAFGDDFRQCQKNINLGWLSIPTARDPRFKNPKCLSNDKR